MRKAIAEEPWSYVLFEDGGEYILTVLIGGVVDVGVSVQLTSEEVQDIRRNPEAVADLAERVRQNRAEYRDREVKPPIWE